MIKKIFLLLILVLALKSSVFSEEIVQPLKLTIETDKKIYNVGDDIKVIYTIENISEKQVAFFSNESSFQFEIVDNKEYEDLKYTVQFLGHLPENIVLQPGEKWMQEEMIARIRKDEVYKISGVKVGGPVEKKLYYDGLYIDIPAHYKKLLARNGFGYYSILFEFCDGGKNIGCAHCPYQFGKEDCSLLGTGLLHEVLKEKRRKNWEAIRDKLSGENYELNKKRLLEEYDGYDSIKIRNAERYCEKIKKLNNAWQGCLDSNIVRIQIIEKKEQ